MLLILFLGPLLGLVCKWGMGALRGLVMSRLSLKALGGDGSSEEERGRGRRFRYGLSLY